MPEEQINPMAPQDAPKANGGPQGTPVAAPQLSPVQEAIIGRTEAMKQVIPPAPAPEPTGLGEAIMGAIEGFGKQIVKQTVSDNLVSVGDAIYDTGKATDYYMKETSQGTVAGVEGVGRAAANMLPDRWFTAMGVEDSEGKPIKEFSTDPKDFYFAPQGEWGAFVSEAVTQATISYLIAQTGAAAIGPLASQYKAAGVVKKLFDVTGNKTKLGRALAFMNVNGLENNLQRVWDSRQNGVADVRWWAKTLGLEDKLPEILASGKPLSSLEQAVSDYLGGATGGALTSMVIGGIAKIGLGIMAKSADELFDAFSNLPKNNPQRLKLAAAVAGSDPDAQIKAGLDQTLEDPMFMRGQPPEREFTGGDQAELDAQVRRVMDDWTVRADAARAAGLPEPPLPPLPQGPNLPVTGRQTRPVFDVSPDDAAAARQRITERFGPTREAVGQLEELKGIAKSGEAKVRTESGVVLSGKSLEVPIAVKSKELTDSVVEMIQKLDDPNSNLDPATREMLRKDIVTVFTYEWSKLIDEEMPKILTGEVNNTQAAKKLINDLGEMGLPKIISWSHMHDQDLFGAIGVKAVLRTFGRLWDGMTPTQQGVLLEAIAENRAIRYGAERNPTTALSNQIQDALRNAPDDVKNYGPTAAAAIVEITLARDSILQTVRFIDRLLPDGNPNRLTREQRAQATNAIIQTFLASLRLRKAVKTGTLTGASGADPFLNEAALARAQTVLPTRRQMVTGSKEVPSRTLEELTEAAAPASAQKAGLEVAANMGVPAEPVMPRAAAFPEPDIAIREVVDQTNGEVILSDIPFERSGGYAVPTQVGPGYNLPATILSELNSQKDTLGEDILILIRAGVLDEADTKAVLRQLKTEQGGLTGPVMEFLNTLMDEDQIRALEALSLMTEILRKPDRGAFNPFARTTGSGDLPTALEIQAAVEAKARQRIASGEQRFPDITDPKKALVAEAEADLIEIERQLMNMAKGDVRTANVTADINIPAPESKGERRLNRLLNTYSKAHLTYSAKNVLIANSVQYAVEFLGAQIMRLMRMSAKTPRDLASIYRANLMFKVWFTHNIKALGAIKEVAKTGRSTLSPIEARAADALNRVRTARGRVIEGADPSALFDLDNPNIGGEFVVNSAARTLPMMDEVFRLKINETEFKTSFVYRWLDTNKSQDVAKAASEADAAWDQYLDQTVMRTEGELMRDAAKKVDALGIYRDPQTGKIKDPITYTAAVRRQYNDDMNKAMRMRDPAAAPGTEEYATSGLDATAAPKVLSDTNASTRAYLDYSASTLDPTGTTAGALNSVLSGMEQNKLTRFLLGIQNLFVKTRVNEIYKALDFASAPLHLLFKSEKGAASKSFFFTRRELYSGNALERARAQNRIAMASLLAAGYAVYRATRPDRDEETEARTDVGQVTVESATGARVGESGEITQPAVTILDERSSRTARQSRRILETKRGAVMGKEIPIVTPALAIWDFVGTIAESGARKGSRAMKGMFGDNDPSVKAANEMIGHLEDAYQDGVTDGPEAIGASLLEIADILGASDFVEATKESITEFPNPIVEFMTKILGVPLGGFQLYGTLAELQSGYKLENRSSTPFGEKKTAGIWAGAPDFTGNVVRFLGRKGRESRDITGAKKKLKPGLEGFGEKLGNIVLGLSEDYALDLGDGKSERKNRTLAKLLAQAGYPVPYVDRMLTDPDPTRNGGKADLRKFTMGDNRDAHSHLLDLYMYGDSNIEISDPFTAANPIGGIGGKKNQNLIEYLYARLGDIGDALPATIADPNYQGPVAPELSIPTRPLNVREPNAELFKQRLTAALNERLKAARTYLLSRSDEDKKAGRTSMSLRDDFEKIADGGIK